MGQLISLVIGHPSECMESIFSWPFYDALGDDDSEPDDLGPQALKSIDLYRSYLSTSGLKLHMQARKLNLFRRFASAEASPECMTNYGDNDPEWSRAYHKVALLVEFHPSSIIRQELPRPHGQQGPHCQRREAPQRRPDGHRCHHHCHRGRSNGHSRSGTHQPRLQRQCRRAYKAGCFRPEHRPS